jgi:hypothetical protein
MERARECMIFPTFLGRLFRGGIGRLIFASGAIPP